MKGKRGCIYVLSDYFCLLYYMRSLYTQTIFNSCLQDKLSQNKRKNKDDNKTSKVFPKQQKRYVQKKAVEIQILLSLIDLKEFTCSIYSEREPMRQQQQSKQA